MELRFTKPGWVYIFASRQNGTIYIGVTGRLQSRDYEHKQHLYKGSFTDKYNIETLVWYEFHEFIGDAIMREKKIKKFRREWKIALIEKDNPLWKDLSKQMRTEMFQEF